jgi:cold shock CspA family protein
VEAVIRQWFTGRGFGFARSIAGGDLGDVFVHARALVDRADGEWIELPIGTRLRFDVVQDAYGRFSAVNVVRVGEAVSACGD